VTDVADMIKVNCGAIVNMTRCLLPLFKHRKGGAIVNVSSGSCAQPSPYLATYASTKAFDLHFSKSCSREGASHGVVVLGIRPYYICGTGLYPNAKPSLNAPSASTIVDGAFNHLGRYEVSHAYWMHGVLGWMFGTLFEDPVAAPVIARLAKRAGVKGTMLAIQAAARARSQEKLAATWLPVKAAAQEHLRRLGCVK
jgi:NAD(P)-dependent dehydrogenase (short-subunit alcohol dehydrogenase family)